MKLIRQVGKTVAKSASLTDLLKLARQGDYVLLFKGHFYWCEPHPEGVAIAIDHWFLVIGNRLLFWRTWYKPKKVVFEGGQKLFLTLNGERLLSGRMWYKQKKVVNERPTTLLLIPKTSLSDCGQNEYLVWRHPKGVFTWYHNQLRLDGETLLFRGTCDEGQWHPKGLVTRHGDELRLNGVPLFKGECDEWQSHPKGVVTRHGDELRLNGKTLIFKGALAEWMPHPEGVVTRHGDELRLYPV